MQLGTSKYAMQKMHKMQEKICLHFRCKNVIIPDKIETAIFRNISTRIHAFLKLNVLVLLNILDFFCAIPLENDNLIKI